MSSPAPAAPQSGERGGPLFRFEAWRVGLGGFVDGAPVVEGDDVYAAAWSGRLLRLALADGASRAELRLPDAVDAAPALGPDCAAVLCWDRGLYLIGRDGLEVRDVFREAESPHDDHRQSSPVFAGRLLIAATWAGFVRAFDTAGGRLVPLWFYRAGGPFRGGLTLDGKRLLAPCADGKLYAFEPASGRLAWCFDAGAPLLSAATAGARAVYVADRSGRLHGVDSRTGRLLWTTGLGGPAWYAPALLSQGVLFQGSDSGRLQAVEETTGREIWATELGAGVRAQPASVGRAIAVPTLGGRVHLLDRETGAEWDHWELGGPSQSSPAVSGSRLVLGARDGAVRALDVSEGGKADP